MDDVIDTALIEEPTYPFQDMIGFRMVGWKPDWARFELPITGEFDNRHGIPHGGVYAVLLDTVMGFAGCYTGDKDVRRSAITLSLTTNYLSRPKGKLLIAEGWRTGGGKSTYFAEGRVTDETGEVLAKGSAVFRYRKSALPGS